MTQIILGLFPLIVLFLKVFKTESKFIVFKNVNLSSDEKHLQTFHKSNKIYLVSARNGVDDHLALRLIDTDFIFASASMAKYRSTMASKIMRPI